MWYIIKFKFSPSGEYSPYMRIMEALVLCEDYEEAVRYAQHMRLEFIERYAMKIKETSVLEQR